MLLPTHAAGGPRAEWRTVVGVVSDVRYRGLDDVRLDVYDPALQAATPADNLVIRSSRDWTSVAAAVQAEARRMDPGVVIDGVTTMEAIVERAAAPWRFSVWMFSFFAALAFVLATVGLFSGVSLDVAHRRREFAVRLALGASRADIVRAVVLRAGARLGPGLALGIVAAAIGAQAIRGLLFGVAALDAATYAVVAVIVAGAVIVASYVPARRAAGADPLPLLREE
jgi:hypothetical protein